MGQPEWERQNKTSRTEAPEQDCQHRAAKIKLPGQDKKERTAEKTARTGHLDRTARTEHPGKVKQTGEKNRTASTTLSGQYCKDRMLRAEQPRQDSCDMTAKKGKPEQNSPNGTSKNRTER
jgi:hypothetical protein